MELKNFMRAMELLTGFHTTEVVINKPKYGFVGDIIHGKPNLYLKSANAGAIKALQSEGFTVDLHDGFLQVQDYAKQD